MGVFITVVLCVGCVAFAAYSLIKLLGAIQEKRAQRAASEDKGKEEK